MNTLLLYPHFTNEDRDIIHREVSNLLKGTRLKSRNFGLNSQPPTV